MTTVDEAIEILNRIHTADPTVLQTLISYRVPCNQALADDPTVQVGKASDRAATDANYDYYEVGLLGIVNGLFGVDDQSWGFIAANYDDAGHLVNFIRTPPRSSTP